MRADLIELLRPYSPHPDRPLMADLVLAMRRGEPGRVADARPDDQFNRDKGDIFVSTGQDGRTVAARVLSIEPRAFMRVTILYAGVREVQVSPAAKVLVPFSFDALQDRCFQTNA